MLADYLKFITSLTSKLQEPSVEVAYKPADGDGVTRPEVGMAEINGVPVTEMLLQQARECGFNIALCSQGEIRAMLSGMADGRLVDDPDGASFGTNVFDAVEKDAAELLAEQGADNYEQFNVAKVRSPASEAETSFCQRIIAERQACHEMEDAGLSFQQV